MVRRAARKEQKSSPVLTQGHTSPAELKKKKDGAVVGDEIAAIAIALYKYSEDLHDIEDTVLTINRAAKVYSPWSSKIYSLRQTPVKK